MNKMRYSVKSELVCERHSKFEFVGVIALDRIFSSKLRSKFVTQFFAFVFIDTIKKNKIRLRYGM